MSIILQLKSVATAISGTLFRNKLVADMNTIESTVNAHDVQLNALQASASVAVWTNGGTYAIGAVVYSPTSFLNYRNKTGATGTDPAGDATNWVDMFTSLAGSVSRTFAVAAATDATHAVRADQFKAGMPSVVVQHNTPSSGLIAFTLNPGIWHFRNPSIYDGTPTFRINNAALTLATTNIGASFGATTGIQTRLYLLVIDDGTGDPVLGVTLGKGLQLDETNLINATSTIAGAVNSDATVYTTVALPAASYAYKVVGVVDVIWTNGSGWVTAPALVQSRDNTTLHYAEGTFTAVMSGCSSYTQQTQTIRWVKNGKQVTLTGEGAAMSGTSNAASKPLAGLPQILWPAQTRNIIVSCQDNGGQFVAAAAIISSTGTITCYANLNTNSFTTSGTASVDVFGCSYAI